MRVALACGYEEKLFRREFNTIFLRKTVFCRSYYSPIHRFLARFPYSISSVFPFLKQDLSSIRTVLIYPITSVPILHYLTYLFRPLVTGS